MPCQLSYSRSSPILGGRPGRVNDEAGAEASPRARASRPRPTDSAERESLVVGGCEWEGPRVVRAPTWGCLGSRRLSESDGVPAFLARPHALRLVTFT